MNAARPPVYTIGHSTRPQPEFMALLQGAQVAQVVDVRAFPRSRTNPQFNADVLAEALHHAGLSYRHLPALGGRRHRAAAAAPSPNTLWREVAFRNYADYALTPAFRAGFDQLLELAATSSCAIMCAEAVWWRCHRRIIADYLLAAGVPVMHILGRDSVVAAALTPGAEPAVHGTIRYPGPTSG